MPGPEPDERSLAHFRARGWMRVGAAFGSDAAARMRDAVWRALAAEGIDRDRPETWTLERPVRLQRLKRDPVFQAIGSEALFAAIDAIFEGRGYPRPKDWGGFFIAFPGVEPWGVPHRGWHLDARYTGALWPVRGVKTLALLGDVVPRGGGTQIVSGSHRLVHGWFRDHPPPADARGADLRRLLQGHPYLRDLHRAGPREDRIARFHRQAEEIDGVALRVIEATGAAGDVILLHPLVLHVAAPNTASEPRFLLSGGITTDMWGWAAAEA
jgi:hypothetical protein